MSLHLLCSLQVAITKHLYAKGDGVPQRFRPLKVVSRFIKLYNRVMEKMDRTGGEWCGKQIPGQMAYLRAAKHIHFVCHFSDWTLQRCKVKNNFHQHNLAMDLLNHPW